MVLSELLSGEDVVNIAQRLLGATLITTLDGHTTSGKIVETEAYRAPEDKGSHAFGNRRTNRTETLFARAGTVYVYLCYGIHHLFNIVTGPKDTAHAVLIRGLEPIDGMDKMLLRRNMNKIHPNLTNGPGKLTQALGITTAHNNVDLLHQEHSLIQVVLSPRIEQGKILASPRVGIGYAQECAHWPWRFRIKDNQWTSKPDRVMYPWS